MKPILIAEIGNCHQGDITQAKELIRVAKESGATLVKGQAFLAEEISGSMPFGFYKDCEFSQEEYLELIHYAKEDVGIDLFYSIFSRKLLPMSYHQRWHKFSGSQTKKNPSYTERMDWENVFVSIPAISAKPNLEKAKVMYVTDYLTTSPHLEHIDLLKEYYKRPVGYSDHTVGIEYCILANKECGANVIEKHFTLTRDIFYDGHQFRDAVHSALPDQFAKLAKIVGN